MVTVFWQKSALKNALREHSRYSRHVTWTNRTISITVLGALGSGVSCTPSDPNASATDGSTENTTNTSGAAPTTSGAATVDDSTSETSDIDPGYKLDLPDCWYPDGWDYVYGGLGLGPSGTLVVLLSREESWCGPGTGYRCEAWASTFSQAGELLDGDPFEAPVGEWDCRSTLVTNGEHTRIANNNVVRSFSQEWDYDWYTKTDKWTSSIAVTANGLTYVSRIVGYQELTILALDVEGDFAFEPVPLSFEIVHSSAALPAGDVIVAGDGDVQLVRVDEAGTLVWELALEQPVIDIAVEGASSDIYALQFAAQGPDQNGRLVRIHEDGSLDPTFVVDFGAQLVAPRAVTLTSEGPCVLDSSLSFASVWCVDHVGDERWKTDIDPDDDPSSWSLSQGAYSETFLQPLESGGVVLLNRGELVALSPTGTLMWRAMMPVPP